MYAVLRGDGSIEQLPGVESGCIDGDYLICLGAEGKEVARYPASDSAFGRLDALQRIAQRLLSRDWQRVERLLTPTAVEADAIQTEPGAA